MLPILILVLGGAAVAAVVSSRPSSGAASKPTLRAPHRLGLIGKSKAKPFSIRHEDPASAIDVAAQDARSTEVAMLADVRAAWTRVVKATVDPFVQIAEYGRPVGERRNLGFSDGQPVENHEPAPLAYDWSSAVASGRAMRDAFAFGTLRVGYSPDGSKPQGQATAEKVKLIAGKVGEAMASVTGAVAFAGSALAAVGVPTSTVGAIMGAVGAAAAAVGPGVAFLAGAVAVQAAIVGLAYAIFGEAKGSTHYGYIADGAEVDQSITDAIHLRDAGGRLSHALSGIAPRGGVSVPLDGMAKKYGADWYQTVDVPEIRPEEIEAQRRVEDWIAEFLRRCSGLPRLRAATDAELSQLAQLTKYLPAAKKAEVEAAAIARVVGVQAFDWLRTSVTTGPVSIEGSRKMLALFAGLGEQEADWLAKTPGTRGGPFQQ